MSPRWAPIWYFEVTFVTHLLNIQFVLLQSAVYCHCFVIRILHCNYVLQITVFLYCIGYFNYILVIINLLFKNIIIFWGHLIIIIQPLKLFNMTYGWIISKYNHLYLGREL